ncbi:MAG: aspartyl/asparaginyl beta-hydroxylase domain-containing protein [Betaproteobacteria bacterium]
MIVLAFIAAYLACILAVHLRGRVRHSFWGQVFDHSGLLAPVNVFLYAFSAVPTRKPFLPLALFPELEPLRQHADAIREEGLALMAHARMRSPDGQDDAGFNSFAKAGWKRFYLKWYGDDAHPSALRLCPRTTALLRAIPNVSGAMFATLPPGAVLNPHRDPYAGSMRYHLGLVTPNDDACRIEVDGQAYSWRDGEGVIFDETFIHRAENRTDVERLILFCDVERPLRTGFARSFNRWFGRHVVAAASSPNEADDPTGLINRVFFLADIAGRYRRRFKAWNRTVYKLTKGALVLALACALVLPTSYRTIQHAMSARASVADMADHGRTPAPSAN